MRRMCLTTDGVFKSSEPSQIYTDVCSISYQPTRIIFYLFCRHPSYLSSHNEIIPVIAFAKWYFTLVFHKSKWPPQWWLTIIIIHTVNYVLVLNFDDHYKNRRFLFLIFSLIRLFRMAWQGLSVVYTLVKYHNKYIHNNPYIISICFCVFFLC